MYKYAKTYLLFCDQMLNYNISHVFAIRISLPVQPMNGAEKNCFKYGYHEQDSQNNIELKFNCI